MHKYSVVSNEALTPTTTIITLRLDVTERPFAFVPGQYAAISFYHKSRPSAARCFSIVSSPTEPGILQFSMRNGGRFTRALSRVPVGGTIEVRGPFGGFVFDQIRDRQAVFLAGGIGITPFMSMIRYLSQIQAPNEITLLYSCRNQDDIPFFEELKRLEQSNPHFHVSYVIGQGATDKLHGQTVKTGFISPEVIDGVVHGAYAERSFYICGPPPFMKGMTNILRAKGTAEDRILTEAFGQGSNRQTGKLRSWPFNIYVMGAVGVALGSLIVMAVDLLKTLPPTTLLGLSNAEAAPASTNSRQADLDQLVNSLPSSLSPGPPSDAVIAARLAAVPKTAARSATPAPAPAVIYKPAPTPRALVCSTTPSGVKTCY